ncbi:peptidase family M3 [Trichoderma evansii]
MASPDYSNPPQQPNVFTYTPESILATSKALCDHVQEVYDKIAALPLEMATFDNVCQPLIQIENERQAVTCPLDILQKCSPNQALREATDEAEKARSTFFVNAMRKDVFQRIEALYQRRESLGLHPEYLRWLEFKRRDYVREGLALEDEAQMNRYKEISKRLSSLVAEFNRNFDEEKGPICWFTPEELDGVPEETVAKFEKGTGENEGKLKVDLSTPGLRISRRCNVASTRKTIGTENTKMGKINVPLFDESVRLMHESVKILGYPTTAAFRLENNMAKTPERVSAFLNDLHKRVEQHKAKEVKELQQLKDEDRAARGLPQEELFSWDFGYYDRIRMEKESIDYDKLSDYFPLQQTVANMLKLFGSLFGFVFVELSEEDGARLSPTGKASDLTWHEDVMLYSVWDDPGEGGRFRGYLYLDLYHREGKYRGYQCWPLTLGYDMPDGKPKYPATVLMTMFPKPTEDKPYLLQQYEVRLLFHELGHGIHDLSGASKCSRFFGASTAGDFNEAPSQMLEQWCWIPQGLKTFSSHHKTGKQLPDDMLEAKLETKTKSGLGTLMGMLQIALFDLDVYSATGDVDLGEIYSKYKDFFGMRGPEDKYGYVQWRNLIHGGEVSMYSYLWSKVHAMDMYDSAFCLDPLDGVAGRRYRHMVLEKGAEQDEMKTLVDFLGREPSSDAYFKDLGFD